MKAPLFEYPSYQYKVKDWEFKKKGLLNRINKGKFIRTELQTFETDRQTCGKSYVKYFENFLMPELTEFCSEANVSCNMTDAWCVKYKKGDRQDIHNHRGWGFSGILYVNFDPRVHKPTCFMAPWQDPRTDSTLFNYPSNIVEGTLFIAPSFSHHLVHPSTSGKERTIVAFDLLPTLPEHQSLNKNV